MAIIPPPPGQSSGGHTIRLRPPRALRLLALLAVIPAILLLGICYRWFVQRVEVRAGEFLVLVRKVGRPIPETLPDGSPVPDWVRTQMVLYPGLLEALNEPPDSTRYKGIMYEVLTEGRHFRDPFLWDRQIHKMVVIGPNEIGIKIRKYGRPLPLGKTVATEPDERGPLKEGLRQGRHNVNPYAYEVRRFPQIEVPAGFVGVQTLYYGADPSNPNDYVVQEGERGVQPNVLPPGLYYKNPYVTRVDLIDVRSHTLDLRYEDAIRFPSSDSFEIVLEATVEYAISQDKAPYVIVAIGGHEDIEEKLILPYARSLSRIEGSKLLAREFISGETRQAFQNAFFDGLREQCATQGIEIRATPIRRIEPPAAIANPISDRQLAAQQIAQYQNEIKVAQSQAKLVEQEEMQDQNQAIGQADRQVVTTVKQAEQTKAVALTDANKRLEVAKLRLEAAREQAAAMISRGKAEAEVILLEAKAEAEPLTEAVSAFGSGDAYAQYFFYQRLAPALKSVLASTDGPFADIFRSLSQAESTGAAEGGER